MFEKLASRATAALGRLGLGCLLVALPAAVHPQEPTHPAAVPSPPSADDAPLAAAPQEGRASDPCAPVRRISPEFGEAFASFAPDGNEAPAVEQPASAAIGGPPAMPPAAAMRTPWRPPPANRAGPPAPPFLASKLVPVGRTGFDREWRRVRDVTVAPACASMLLGSAPPPSPALLATVTAWVNRHVRYVEDSGRDHWAAAPATLRLGYGDCEDVAIVKMQLLAALGVPEEAMYLSLVRDLVRGRDHAVLIVRLADRPWLLDATTDRVLDARAANDYQAVMSFSASRKWLHGR